MATKSIECPSCDARLKVAATLPAGKKIRCPKCESAIVVPDGEEEPIEVTPETPMRKRKPAPPPEEVDFDDEEEEVEERPARRPRKKPKKAKSNAALIVGLALGALVLVTGGVLAFVLWPSKAKNTPVAQNTNPTPASVPATTTPPQTGDAATTPPTTGDSGTASSGRKVFEDQKCGRCHDLGGGSQGKGRRNGPDLSRVGAKRNAEYIMEHVRDPKSHLPSSRMPGYDAGKISQQDLKALGEFLASLK